MASQAEYFGDLRDDARLRRALDEALNPALDLFADAGFDSERIFERAAAGPRTYAALFDAIMSDSADRAGKVRWSEKSAGQPIDAAWSLFPDAQVVHIVRDPRDVVASSMRTVWTDPDPVAVARGWRDFTLRAIRRGAEAGPSRYLQIRYEDLAREPAAMLRVVCAYLGEEYEPAMLDDPALRRATVPAIASGWQGQALGAVVPAREGGWRAALSRADARRVHAVVGPMLAPLGYEPPDLRELVTAAPFVAAEALHRARERLRGPEPPLSPEERYRRARQFQERQARRVRDAAAR